MIVPDQVSVAVLNNSMAILQSREVPCASNAKIFIAYFRTEKASIMLCIKKQCVSINDSRSGKLFFEIFNLSIKLTRRVTMNITMNYNSSSLSLIKLLN